MAQVGDGIKACSFALGRLVRPKENRVNASHNVILNGRPATDSLSALPTTVRAETATFAYIQSLRQ